MTNNEGLRGIHFEKRLGEKTSYSDRWAERDKRQTESRVSLF